MQDIDPPLRFIVVAENNQQRMAFSDTIRTWQMELVDCISVHKLNAKHFHSAADVWLVDSEKDYEVIQSLEEEMVRTSYSCMPKAVLVGFTPAPYINTGALYEKWQRKLKRKIADSLQRPDLLLKEREKSDDVVTWRYVIMLGASMGGPMAVKEFLDYLPHDLPIALILAQHFNRERLYTLPRILTRHNQWRCDVIANTQQLLAGRCLIVPVEQSVVCDSNGRVLLQKQGWQGMYEPSISQLLATCSNVFGNHLITIIFSGMGNDGSDTAQLARKNNSVIWVQSPDSSECPSQPQNMIDTGFVDYVGTPKQLAEALVSLCKKRCLPDGTPILLAPNPLSYQAPKLDNY
ncbi:CheB methylesterase [Moraxella macacae 0408225]|uniref:protein-glutamate methylesterase n=2 Tax=Pseudomonadota TaxID=1224 RepID=L2FBD2_9GAMM|nr:chemotaxis protein CheB [Moraxella macacae]ELA09748.1 CheB methylesterase [Moraxella macacae 0408225]